MKTPLLSNKKFQRQVGASCLVIAVFTFFIINGPLQRLQEHLSLEVIKTKFSEPIMLGRLSSQHQSGLVGEVETKGHGHALILERKEKKSSFGLLKEETTSHNHESEKALLKHSLTLYSALSRSVVVENDKAYIQLLEEGIRSYYFESHFLVTDILGYAGPINVGIRISESGELVSIHHISSQETQSYLFTIKEKGYYGHYDGLSLSESAVVDGVSGATITSEAIALTVNEAVKLMFPAPFENLISDHKIHRFNVRAENSNIWIVHTIVLSLLFAYGLLTKLKSKKWTTSIRVVSILYLGFYLNNSFTYTSFLHPFMGVSLSVLTSVYMGLVLLGAIWGKNIYCAYVCPFGNVQCLAGQLRPKTWSAKFFLSNKILKGLRILISVSLIAGIYFGMDRWKNFELFPDLFGADFTSFWFSIAVVFVLIAIKYPMLWCRSLCPTGFVLDTFNELVFKGVPSIQKKRVAPKSQPLQRPSIPSLAS